MRILREKLIILPKLQVCSSAKRKQWHVCYSCQDPSTGKMKRFRLYEGFAELKTKNEKLEHGRIMVDSLKKKLLNGWSPFEDRDKVIYSDDLVYKKVANIYGRLRNNVKTFNYYANEYLKNHLGIRPSTYTTYKSKFRYFEEYLKMKKIEGNSINTIGKAEAEEFNVYLKKNRNLSSKTINEYNVLMRTFFKRLIEGGHVNDNPFLGIKKLKTQTKKPRIYNGKYMDKIVKWAEKNDKQLLLVIRLIFNCLIRPGELRQIIISDVDLENGRITVPAHVAKNGKQRVVDVPDYLANEMKKQSIDKLPGSWYIISNEGMPGPVMKGRNHLYRRFVRMREATQIPKQFILYAFKHTGMVELKRSGADWLEIKSQAGHQSLDQVIAYMTELMGESSEHIKKRGPRI